MHLRRTILPTRHGALAFAIIALAPGCKSETTMGGNGGSPSTSSTSTSTGTTSTTTAPPTCSDGVKNGAETDIDCGGPTCPPCAVGKGCAGFADCQSGVCAGGLCADLSCSDNLKNGSETDIDCGGPTCPPCAAGKACAGFADCQSGVCAGGVCVGSSCTDNLKNGAETDIDCGGPTCSPCAIGKTCSAGADCQTGDCQNGVCQATDCTDGAKNGAETDIDCGGTVCPKCAVGQGCVVGADCQAGVCQSAVCQAPTCSDGVKNGSETDKDCGGFLCPKCAVGKACTTGADCQDNACIGGVCSAPGCANGVKDGSESDVDCGGSSCAPCATGAACTAGGDCQSGACVGGVCQAPTCSDGVKNGAESDVDCGGFLCGACDPGAACAAASDCKSGVCTSGTCQAPTCSDGVKNGAESDLDCGGFLCPKCMGGKTCAANGDCLSNVCMGGVCQGSTSCVDGLKNGAETDVDCGGGACPKCADGRVCATGADCAGGLCAAGVCCTPEAKATTCAGKCSLVANNCGQQVDCGGCAYPFVCGTNTCSQPPQGVLWSRTFGGTSSQYGRVAGIDAASNVFVTGYFQGSINLGGGALTSAGLSDIYLGKLDPWGYHVWSKRFGGVNGEEIVVSSRLDPAGNFVIFGNGYGDVDLGGGTLTSPGGWDVIIAKYDPSGNPLWGKRLGDASDQDVFDGVVDASGNLYVGGQFEGTLNFGSGAITCSGIGMEDGYFAKLDPNGNHVWSRRYGVYDAYEQTTSLALDSAGNLYVAGHFQKDFNFTGGTTLSPYGGAGDFDLFIAKFDTNGNHIWSKSFGGPQLDFDVRVAVDASNSPVVFGNFNGTLVLGGTSLVSAGGQDWFIARLDSNGNWVYRKRFGGANSDGVNAVTAAPNGDLLIAGGFLGTVNFGNGAVMSASGGTASDTFLFRLSPTGTYVSLYHSNLGTSFNRVYLDSWGIAAVSGSPNSDAYFAKIVP